MSHHHRRAAAISAPDPFFQNTVLLLTGNGTNGGQNNTFLDDSSNNFTITRYGNTTQGSFSPFTGAGGSGYFDGNGDYLSVSDNASLRMGTGNFTIEFWIYFTSISGYQTPLTKGYNVTGSLTFQTGNGDGKIVVYTGSPATALVTASTAATVNAWNHYALVRSGTTLTLYLNGSSVGTATNSTDFNSTGNLGIGSNLASLFYPISGYISNLRILKGTAQYTSNFTPPTSPLAAITDTQLLLNFTNGSIVDATGKNDLETVGNAQISTTVKKYGTGSLAFDGTGDWLTVRDTADLRLGTGNFTIEFWLYLAATGSARGCVGKGTATTGWLVSTDSSNKVVFTYGSSTITSTGALSGSTWYHIAVVREGTGTNQTKIYIDGTNDGTGTVSTDFTQTNLMYIGADRTGGSAMNGNIDDLRITKTARYTANFTPPYRQLPTR